MSTNRSASTGVPIQKTRRFAVTQEHGRPARKSKKDRSPSLCVFTFADGRQCRTPRCSGHLHFCYFHAQKEAKSLAAQQVGEDISRFLPTKLLTACDLGVAMSRLFCAVAQGQIKPKVASTLAYLAQTMLQSIPIAQDEYINSFDTDTWRSAVRASFRSDDHDEPTDNDDPADAPAPQPAPESAVNCHSAVVAQAGIYPDRVGRPEESASSSNSSLATPHSPLPPAPSPHAPLPRTSAEFAQQLLAGLNSSRPEIPTPPTPVEAGRNSSRPGREPGSSGSSSSSTSTTTPQSPVNCHSERSEEPASSSNSPLTTRHSFTPTVAEGLAPSKAEGPLPQPAPSPTPPGFGAPANWDVLIPPKPRRRFSRLWHSS